MVQPICHWQEKVFLILVIFNCLFGCALASERNEMVENWPKTFFLLICPGLTFMVLRGFFEEEISLAHEVH